MRCFQPGIPAANQCLPSQQFDVSDCGTKQEYKLVISIVPMIMFVLIFIFFELNPSEKGRKVHMYGKRIFQ
jgi:hypothetical protein